MEKKEDGGREEELPDITMGDGQKQREEEGKIKQ